ncbi:FAD-dependent oxidoreductase [Aeoliella mucimassa]|uniref:Kynurenine 3-monooxygenase n=1 Tax=Aeoliella mucimassa TaxID=2527972 RepID=A0A518AV16_9BACT|nr:FAD-dependent oxidoreductase [Aeoliella mucimassa]QDU58564.1 Kynurenine 3-monooxygenase [Aeoliella mucimassa]
MEPTTPSTICCIVGGGPAGMFLGYLLARAGIQITVLEKHTDFLRDFRGDTIHPSTMQLLKELDLLDEFLPLVDFRTDTLHVNIEGQDFVGPTFKHLNTTCPFIGFVPQWDLLNLMSEQASRYAEFDLRMGTKAVDVIRDNERVVGVRWESATEQGEILADLVVAADGRSSTIRDAVHRQASQQGIPIDVLWFRLDRPEEDDSHTLAWLKNGHMLVTIPRRDHYQTAMVIKKGAFDSIQQHGLPAFRETIAEVCPLLANVAEGVQDWQQVKLLTVEISRLERWHQEGLLFIGDAAHAMSPVGGVGINLAIQDAVATANLLAEPLRQQNVSEQHLAAVQHRRERAAIRTQRVQSMVHSLLFGHASSPGQPFSPPWYVRIGVSVLQPVLRRLAGRWVGIGFQPEHIETPDVHKP